MSDSDSKARKKETKALAKVAKARAKAEAKRKAAVAPAQERSGFRAGAMRFVREGLFQTVVKIIAGLVVAYLLIRFGLR